MGSACSVREPDSCIASISLLVVVRSRRCGRFGLSGVCVGTKWLRLLPLKNRQQLIGWAQGDDCGGRCVGIAKFTVASIAFLGPTAVSTLIFYQHSRGGWEKLSPMPPAQLVHRLAASQQSIEIAVFSVAEVFYFSNLVVVVKAAFQNPISRSLCFGRFMQPGMSQR